MSDIPALGFRPFHIVIAILSLYALQTLSFMPSDNKEFLFGDGGISHQTQTKNAYDQLVQKYFGDIKTSTTMESARKEFADANMAVDDDQGQSALHFDGENFDGGQARLVQQKTLAYKAILANDGSSARQYLGGALHTVQDFYAHSNWVEQQVIAGTLDINLILGISSTDIAHANFNTATCTDCVGLDTQANLLKLCLDCSANVQLGQLTSGYYYGEDSPFGVDPLTGKNVPIPSYKCHHGGIFDNQLSNIKIPYLPLGDLAGVAELLIAGYVPQGINKDSLNCMWSPHHYLHLTAAAMAVQASVQYVDDFVTENALTIQQKRLLFGVGGPTMAFAIDTTGSMGDIIAVAQEESITLASSRLGTPDEPSYYVVAPFNDPTVGPIMKTPNFTTFEADINSLFASGGGDCPELSITGMIDAISVMDPNSDLFMMTDAAPKDYDLVDELEQAATDKKIVIHIYKFDSSCDDGIVTKRSILSKRADSLSDTVYAQIAAVTGGTYHSLPRNEVSTISTVLSAVTASDSVGIFKIISTSNSSAPNTYDLPVDSEMTEFSIALQGHGMAVGLTKPDGTILDLNSTGVNVTSSSEGEFVKVSNPTTGLWKVSTVGSGPFTCDARGVSPLHFSSFDFVELRGRPGHTGYFPINATQPAYDHDVAAIAYLEGNFSTATFDLRGPDGTHLVDANMTRGSGADGDPPKNNFFGEMRLIPGSLYTYLQGIDSSGAPYLRVRPGIFSPILSNTTDTGFDNIDLYALFLAVSNVTSNATNSSASSSSSTSSFSSSITSSTNSSTSSYLNATSSGLALTGSYGYSNGSKTSALSYATHNSTVDRTQPSPLWPVETYCPPNTKVRTISKYITPDCDIFTTTAYTTTTVCPFEVTHVDAAGKSIPTTISTTSTILVTETVVTLCPTCTGPNYPQHTGNGPWTDVASDVAGNGYSQGGNAAPQTQVPNHASSVGQVGASHSQGYSPVTTSSPGKATTGAYASTNGSAVISQGASNPSGGSASVGYYNGIVFRGEASVERLGALTVAMALGLAIVVLL